MNQETLKEYFEYKEGELYCKKKYCRKVFVGKKIGNKNKYGYIQTSFKNKRYYLHRMIFLYHHGHLPNCIDHIDCNKENNKIENLRPSTLQQNNLNMPLSMRNTSGVKGVSWNKDNKNWRITMKINGKSTYLGSYKELDDAKKAVKEARLKYHGAFANHGEK